MMAPSNDNDSGVPVVDDDSFLQERDVYIVESQDLEGDDEVSEVSNSLETEESKDRRRNRSKELVADCASVVVGGATAPQPSHVATQLHRPKARVSFEDHLHQGSDNGEVFHSSRMEDEDYPVVGMAAATAEPPLLQPNQQERSYGKKHPSISFKKLLPNFKYLKFWDFDFGSSKSRRRRHNAMLNAMSSTSKSNRSSSLKGRSSTPRGSSGGIGCDPASNAMDANNNVALEAAAIAAKASASIGSASNNVVATRLS